MNDVEQIRSYYDAVFPYYDATLQDRGDLPFWESVASRWGSKRTLELGCGTGRVTQVLTRHSAVTAVDVLVEMLRRAGQRAPAARLVVADLRSFTFAAAFDLVVMADDPMAHLTSTSDRMMALKRIANHLTAGGRVVLEGLFRPPRQPLRVPARVVRPDEEEMFTVEEIWQPADEENSIWTAIYRFTRGSSVVEVVSTMRSWTRQEVDRLADFGLYAENVWGDFDQSPFRDSSTRIVIVARRRGPLPL